MSIAALCIIFIFAYALIAFLPHSHGVCDSDCSVCARIKSAGSVFAVLSCNAAIYRALPQRSFALNALHLTPSAHGATPVRLKVELLD